MGLQGESYFEFGIAGDLSHSRSNRCLGRDSGTPGHLADGCSGCQPKGYHPSPAAGFMQKSG